MGQVISLAERRTARRRGEIARTAGRPQATFFFDLTSPWTYLAAERIDRLFPGVEWSPAITQPSAFYESDMEHAAARAEMLNMPLVWPERWPATGRAAMRVAALAAEEGRAAPFVLAASRLAFCGGFDLDDPETLAEAAAAASLGLDASLHAARDRDRDAVLEARGAELLAQGADELPGLQIGGLLFAGEHRIPEALAAWRAAFASAPAI